MQNRHTELELLARVCRGMVFSYSVRWCRAWVEEFTHHALDDELGDSGTFGLVRFVFVLLVSIVWARVSKLLLHRCLDQFFFRSG